MSSPSDPGLVLFLDEVHPNVRRGIEEMGYQISDVQTLGREALGPHLANAIGVIVRHRIQLDKELLFQAPNLQWIGRSGVGLDAIDTSYCQARGIQVLNGAGGNADAVGEHVIGLILTMLNHLGRSDREVHQGIWRREANRGRELGQCTLGVIGYGHTGRSLARKVSGFGTEVLAYDKYREVDDAYAKPSSLDDIVAHAEIISFHVPLTDETHHYFDNGFLEKVQKPFYLINTSRGPVCDLEAIAKGLKKGRILGAALDVLPREPKDEGRLDITDPILMQLLSNEKVIFSPHIAGWTEESYINLANVLLERIRAI